MGESLYLGSVLLVGLVHLQGGHPTIPGADKQAHFVGLGVLPVKCFRLCLISHISTAKQRCLSNLKIFYGSFELPCDFKLGI